MLLSLIICISATGATYYLLSRDKVILNILSVSAVFGFISFLIFLLLYSRYSESEWLSEILVSVVYMVIMKQSDLTKYLIKDKTN